MSKGSRQRPTNYQRFAESYERIFGKKPMKCVKCGDKKMIRTDPASNDFQQCICVEILKEREGETRNVSG